jgi:hypothetical protein
MTTLTKDQAEAVAHINSYGVVVEWFVGRERDDDCREFIALGKDFIWSLLVMADGTPHTSEATLGEFNTGIDI